MIKILRAENNCPKCHSEKTLYKYNRSGIILSNLLTAQFICINCGFYIFTDGNVDELNEKTILKTGRMSFDELVEFRVKEKIDYNIFCTKKGNDFKKWTQKELLLKHL